MRPDVDHMIVRPDVDHMIVLICAVSAAVLEMVVGWLQLRSGEPLWAVVAEFGVINALGVIAGLALAAGVRADSRARRSR